MALTIEAQLKELGYEISGITGTGEEAIQMTRELQPDLILMDINLLGDMDGITAAEQIKKFQDVPIIYLTAYSDDETIRRAALTDPSAYLTKPFKIRDLRSGIETAIHCRQSGSGQDSGT